MATKPLTQEELDAQNLALGRTQFSTDPARTGTSITSADLASVTPIKPVQPESTPVAPVNGLNAEVTPLAPLPQETAQSDLIKQIQGLTMDTVGEAGFRAQQEQAQGIPELTKTQSDLSARLKGLQNEALAIPLQIQNEFEGRASVAGQRGLSERALRQNAIQALSVSSLLEASRGNLTTAQSLADRAVAQRFDPIKAEINAKLANLELLSKDPTLTLAQTNRLNAQVAAQTAKAAQVAKAEANATEINSVLNTAIKFGLTDTSLMERIQKATTPLEAKQLAAQYLQDPKAILEIEQIKIENLLKEAQKDKIIRETKLLGEPTKETSRKEKEALKTAQGQIDTLTEKVSLADAILSNPGIRARVGTNIATRTGTGRFGIALASTATGAGAGSFAGPVGTVVGGIVGLGTGLALGGPSDITGTGQQFSGAVHKLASKEFVDALIAAKSQGATFGALTDKEGDALRAAATQLNDWEIKDKDGKGKGVWNIDEKSFKAEVENIKRLANKAIQKSGGGLLQSDENALLDELYQSEGVINPASFFNAQ